MMIDQLRNIIAVNKDEILEMNRLLVEIPSENKYPNGYEYKAQLQYKGFLEKNGFSTDMFYLNDVKHLTKHEAFLNDGRIYNDRPNVVGVLKGGGHGKSLMFSGHMDTVPKGIDRWNQDPFGGKIIGDRQYGLGIFDMKGGMVAALMAAKCLRDLGIQLKGDLFIETVVDEEFGGANGTLASRLRGYQADAAIIPEPTNMAICPINQGGAYYRISFHGKAGRSYSGEQLQNPVFAAARFLEIIPKYHKWRNASTKVHPMFEDQELPTLVQSMRAGNVELDLSDRVPQTCSIDLWIQCNPYVEEKEVYEEFTNFIEPFVKQDELLSKMPPTIEKKMRFLPGTGIDEEHPVLNVIRNAGSDAIGHELPFRGAPFACDSFMFNKYSDTPAVIFGPKGENAHAADEHIYIDDFLKLIEIYALTMIHWCEIDQIKEGSK
jgi:acetylornithine deacetylase